ncbi:MAG: alkaline phosphatase family protein [Candidatus Electrothrix sp. Rat3]|nr:alkaline phosphatase family protein [Candidatus Electrothrix rattekaaiensis]
MKLYVIGIDGATYRVIRPLIDAGKLPNLSRIIEEGSTGTLMSTVPPLSPVAWTTITTGATPSVHGIIDFLAHDKSTKRDFLFNSSHRRVEPIWTLAGDLGRRSCVVNVPLTYPVDPINGFMISGLGTPPTNKGMAWPLEEFEEMKRAIGSYHIDIDLRPTQKDNDLANSLRKVTKNRLRCFDFLLNREPWDLFFFVFTNTDRAQHFFWREHDEGTGPYADMITECYQAADKAVGQVMAEVAEHDGTLMIISDHGFGSLSNSFSLSHWLCNRNLLVSNGNTVQEHPVKKIVKKYLPIQVINFLIRTILKKHWKYKGPSSELDKWIDWEKTKFYSHKKVDTVFLFINEDAFFDAAEQETALKQLREGLLSVTDPKTEKPVILDILDGNFLFGTDNTLAPDLVLVPADGYNFTFDCNDLVYDTPFVTSPGSWSGNHEPEGIVMMWGQHIKQNQDCGERSIMDVMPTMCHLLDLPIPYRAEGSVIKSAFTEAFLNEHKERYDDNSTESGGSKKIRDGIFNPIESEEVINRLKALGYL